MLQHREKIFKALYFLLSLLWLGSVCKQRFSWLASVHYPPTKDGYFYLQEFKVRLLEGRSYYEVDSVFFSLFSFMGRIVLPDEVALYRFIFVFCFLLFTAALLVMAAKRETLWLLPSLCALFWSSDTLFFSSYNFLKYSFSLCFLLFLFALYVRFAEHWRLPVKIIVLVLMLLAMSMHFFTAAIGIMLCVGFIRISAAARVPILGALILSLSAVYFLARDSGKAILESNWIRPEVGWQLYCRLYSCSDYQWAEYLLFTAAFLFLLGFLFVSPLKNRGVLATLLFIIILISLPVWNTRNGLGTRLGMSALWFVVLTLAYSLPLQFQARRFAVVLCLLSACNWYLSEHAFWGTRGRPSEVFPKYSTFMRRLIPPDSILIAEHGMQFAVNYYLNMHSTTKMAVRGEYRSVYSLQNRRKSQLTGCQQVTDPDMRPDAAHSKCYNLGQKWVLTRLAF